MTGGKVEGTKENDDKKKALLGSQGDGGRTRSTLRDLQSVHRKRAECIYDDGFCVKIVRVTLLFSERNRRGVDRGIFSREGTKKGGSVLREEVDDCSRRRKRGFYDSKDGVKT